MTTIFYVLCWFIAIWMSTLIIIKASYKEHIHWLGILLSASGWTAIITHGLKIWG